MSEILENHNLRFEEIINPSILNHTSNLYFYFRPTTGICDCETTLGSKINSHQSTISKLEKNVGVKLKLIDGFWKRFVISLSKNPILKF